MIQVVKYKCCDAIFAACNEPNCYTEKDWTKNLKQYAKEGCKIEMVESFKFEKCECNTKEVKIELPSLFD